jgi:hypothetical protein
MSELTESVIEDQMVQFLVDKGLISKHQHAFIKSQSTATNLLECLRDWLACLESNAQTDVIYVDFSNTFDHKCTETTLQTRDVRYFRSFTQMDWCLLE